VLHIYIYIYDISRLRFKTHVQHDSIYKGSSSYSTCFSIAAPAFSAQLLWNFCLRKKQWTYCWASWDCSKLRPPTLFPVPLGRIQCIRICAEPPSMFETRAGKENASLLGIASLPYSQQPVTEPADRFTKEKSQKKAVHIYEQSYSSRWYAHSSLIMRHKSSLRNSLVQWKYKSSKMLLVTLPSSKPNSPRRGLISQKTWIFIKTTLSS